MPRSRQPSGPAKTRRGQGPQAGGQLRIIGGRWRGRKLAFAAVEGLRPTGDRLRETLFNWLQFHLPGARCLDLFAGSGALGLEALSRGAGSVDFVELDRGAAETLNSQLQVLQADNGRVHHCAASAFLARRAGEIDPDPYDLVFIDPPFAADLWQQALTQLADSGQLAEDARIYVESPRDTRVSAPPGWQLEKEKRAGQVCMRLFSV